MTSPEPKSGGFAIGSQSRPNGYEPLGRLEPSFTNAAHTARWHSARSCRRGMKHNHLPPVSVLRFAASEGTQHSQARVCGIAQTFPRLSLNGN